MDRVAIIGGKRTPFVKAGTAFREQSFLDLGVHVTKEVIKELDINPANLGELVFGTVLLDPRIPNAARELVIRSGLPKSLSAHFVSNNCITGLVAASFVADGISSGRLSDGLAGGAESMSRPALSLSKRADSFYLSLFSARTLSDRLKILSSFRPAFLMPQPPSPKEPSTGLTMGEHCEITAKEFSISRLAQDEFAFSSHQNGSRAQDDGYLAAEIAPLGGVERDGIIRKDTTVERLSRLSPVFDRSSTGTITAGNASALTDGASMVYLMSESRAKQEGREVLGYIEGIEFAAVSPDDGLLMAPGICLPRLLSRKGLGVNDIDIFEIHEAFAAQVLSNLAVWEHGWKRYPELKPIGAIPAEKINVNGGSLAIGHPFAATGGRLILSAAQELKRSGKERAALSVCAAGAMAAAVLISRN